MLKAILLDFDGLVVDTENLSYEVFKNWFKKNYNLNLTIEEFLICVGSHARVLLDYMEEEYDISINRPVFFEETTKLVIENSQELPARKGVPEFIKAVKNNNLKLILTTSSHREKPLFHLKRLGLLEYFDDLVTADDVEHIKPEPDLFNKAIDILGIEKEEALIVEDSMNGLIAGERSGVSVLVYPNNITKSLIFEGAYNRVDNLLEVSIKDIINDFEKRSRKNG